MGQGQYRNRIKEGSPAQRSRGITLWECLDSCPLLLCKQCISADQAGQAGDGFCNKKWKSVDYTIADDACVPIVKDTNHRLQCEQQGPTGGDDDDPIKFQWIDTLEGCNDMDFPLQTTTDPTFFGNELGMGGGARS